MPDTIADFIAKWSKVQASEKSVSQSFLAELCDLLGVPRPTATDDYQFERPVPFVQPDGKRTTKFIDLYKRACFVLEAKKYDNRPVETPELALALETADTKPAKKSKIKRGSGQWDDAMLKAYDQAERYAHNLPADEENPVFLLVVDVGHVIELFADFSQKGKAYIAFPDARSHRIPLADLAKSEVRDLLRTIWLDPQSLDPTRRTVAVTLKVARHLAALAKNFEEAGDPPKLVAEFLTRCLFCMFAEDVGLLPKHSFRDLLDEIKSPGQFAPLVAQLFKEMDAGTGSDISPVLRQKLLRFNGGLFSDPRVLAVNGTQLGLLREAARCEWRSVEPAIFGTLLTQALTARERGQLGAHFTPRAYVERLVLPTVIEPLRADWRAVRDEAVLLATRGDLAAARALVRAFHAKLCLVRVLDPACGSANFLYVTLEHLKRLEGEVLGLLRDFGDTAPPAATVDPHQFLGLEINPRAVPIAELVLWIGYLQWHFRIHGNVLPVEPVLKNFGNIQEADAVLAHDGIVAITGKMATANPRLPGLPANWRDLVDQHTDTIFVWDRHSMKTDPATGREIPDEKRRVVLNAYRNPRPAVWPTADFIVGNPPFIGKSKLREDLGDGYVETLRSVYPDVPESADFVMYWWHKAAEEVLAGRVRRFGFITTNSIKQTFNRRVVKRALDHGVSLRFAIPDHPWIDATGGAAVRIAMTVGDLAYALPEPGVVMEPPPPDPSALAGDLFLVRRETPRDDGASDVIFAVLRGRIGSGLNIGAELEGAVELKANGAVTNNGVMLGGRGFLVLPGDNTTAPATILRPILNGNDVLQRSRDAMVIDFCGCTAEEARTKAPKAYDQILRLVKPERDANRRATRRQNWWLFSEVMPKMRASVAGLNRYIGTAETAKHRIFTFIDSDVVPEHPLIVIGLDDAFHLGVLSSRIHVIYALAAGGTLEDRPRYNKSRCFDPFPFPDCTEKQKARIRKLAEELDAHRNRAQQKHGLGLTDIYNVLEKLRAVAGDAAPSPRSVRAEGGAAPLLTEKEKLIHDAALVATLRQLHDDLDAVVADAYSWPWPLSDADILTRVVALNTARAAEEKAGAIRWLRPEYQAKGELLLEGGGATVGAGLSRDASRRKAAPTKTGKQPWPAELPARIKAVESALSYAERPQSIAGIAKQFSRAKEKDVAEIIETLVSLGRARPGDAAGTFVR